MDVDTSVVQNSLSRIINQTYKLLPLREQGVDWQKPLTTILEEMAGMKRLLDDHGDAFFTIICKMEGLFEYTSEEDFLKYRRTIFEILSLLNQLKKDV